MARFRDHRVIRRLFRDRPPNLDKESLGCKSPSESEVPRNVRLQPFFTAGYISEEQVKAKNSKLEDATAKLHETINARFSRAPQVKFQDQDLAKAMQAAGTSPQSGAIFGEYVEAVVMAQRHSQSESMRGRLAQSAAKVYPVATIVLGLVSFGADAAGFLPLKLVANGLQQVFSAGMDVYDRKEAVLQELEAITDYGPFLDSLRDLVNSSLLLDRATDLLIAMTDFLRESLVYLDKSALKRALEQPWADSKTYLNDARMRLDKQVQKDMQIAFFNWMEQEVNERVVSSISTDLSFREKQRHYSDQRMPGSGKWIFNDERFKSWEREEPSGSKAGVLCCVGLPGAGKTIIASAIVEHLEAYRQRAVFKNPRAMVGVAYVYCSISSEEQQSAVGFVSSIARQLVESPATRPNPLMVEARAFQNQYLGKGPRLADYHRFIGRLIGRLDETFIVVDALDECVDNDKNGNKVREILVRTLLTLDARLLFTSRKVGAVHHLKAEAERQTRPLREMDISPLLVDVKNYVRWRIYDADHGNHRLQTWIKEGNISEAAVVDKVFDKYSGVFNLVRLQMNHIQNLLFPGDVLDALDQAGKTEEQFYDEALRRIASSDSMVTRKHLGFRILGWVLRAKRPIRVAELQEALAMSAFESSGSRADRPMQLYKITEEDLLTTCHGFIQVDSRTGLVDFSHATAKQYLDHTGLENIPFNVDRELAETCLGYISREAFAQGASDDDESFQDRMDNSAFYSYAVQYWGEHVRGELESTLRERVLGFLKDDHLVSSWVQAMNVVENNYTFHGRSQSYMRSVGGLWAAAMFGLHGIAIALIDQGADVDVRDDNGRTALMVAAMRGEGPVVQLLIDRGACVSARDDHGRTALHWATTANRLEAMKALVARRFVDCDVNARDEDRCTPLHYAVEEGFEEMATILLECGANPTLKNKGGWTALDSAAPAGYLGIAAKILDHGADVNSVDRQGFTALHWVVTTEHAGIARLLLGRGAESCRAAGTNLVGPLHLAAYAGNVEMASLLLNASTTGINLKDHMGCTPLHVAALSGRDDMVELLIERGTDVEILDEDGWTPLHAACLRDHEAVKQVLMDRVGNSGAEEVVEWVRQHTNDPSNKAAMEARAHDKLNYPIAITRALEIISRGRIEKVRHLLSNGLDVNGARDWGWTPLCMAANSRQTEVARLLLDNGADVNIAGPSGMTALHWAVHFSQVDMVLMFIAEGADVDAADERGHVALSYVRYAKVEELLISAGANSDVKRLYAITATYPAEPDAGDGSEADAD